MTTLAPLAPAVLHVPGTTPTALPERVGLAALEAADFTPAMADELLAAVYAIVDRHPSHAR